MSKKPDPEEALPRANLVRFRDEFGWSVPEAAERIRILSPSYLQKIETGERSLPGIAVLAKILEVYGHTVADLMSETPPPANPSLMPALPPFKTNLEPEDAELVADEIAAFEKVYRQTDLDLRQKLKKRKLPKKH